MSEFRDELTRVAACGIAKTRPRRSSHHSDRGGGVSHYNRTEMDEIALVPQGYVSGITVLSKPRTSCCPCLKAYGIVPRKCPQNGNNLAGTQCVPNRPNPQHPPAPSVGDPPTADWALVFKFLSFFLSLYILTSFPGTVVKLFQRTGSLRCWTTNYRLVVVSVHFFTESNSVREAAMLFFVHVNIILLFLVNFLFFCLVHVSFLFRYPCTVLPQCWFINSSNANRFLY